MRWSIGSGGSDRHPDPIYFPPSTVALVAVPTLVVGVGQLYGGWIAWHGRRWRVAVGIGVLGLLFGPNPILIPVKVVALVLLGISEDQFP